MKHLKDSYSLDELKEAVDSIPPFPPALESHDSWFFFLCKLRIAGFRDVDIMDWDAKQCERWNRAHRDEAQKNTAKAQDQIKNIFKMPNYERTGDGYVFDFVSPTKQNLRDAYDEIDRHAIKKLAKKLVDPIPDRIKMNGQSVESKNKRFSISALPTLDFSAQPPPANEHNEHPLDQLKFFLEQFAPTDELVFNNDVQYKFMSEEAGGEFRPFFFKVKKALDDLYVFSKTLEKFKITLFHVNAVDRKAYEKDKDGVLKDAYHKYKYMLIEADAYEDEVNPEHGREIQYKMLKAVKIPYAMMTWSGHKSIHTLVKIDAKNKREFDKRVEFLTTFCKLNGFELDDNCKNNGRQTRLPSMIRYKVIHKKGEDGKDYRVYSENNVQGVQYLIDEGSSSEFKSYDEWYAWASRIMFERTPERPKLIDFLNRNIVDDVYQDGLKFNIILTISKDNFDSGLIPPRFKPSDESLISNDMFIPIEARIKSFPKESMFWLEIEKYIDYNKVASWAKEMNSEFELKATRVDYKEVSKSYLDVGFDTPCNICAVPKGPIFSHQVDDSRTSLPEGYKRWFRNIVKEGSDSQDFLFSYMAYHIQLYLNRDKLIEMNDKHLVSHKIGLEGCAVLLGEPGTGKSGLACWMNYIITGNRRPAELKLKDFDEEYAAFWEDPVQVLTEIPRDSTQQKAFHNVSYNWFRDVVRMREIYKGIKEVRNYGFKVVCSNPPKSGGNSIFIEKNDRRFWILEYGNNTDYEAISDENDKWNWDRDIWPDDKVSQAIDFFANYKINWDLLKRPVKNSVLDGEMVRNESSLEYILRKIGDYNEWKFDKMRYLSVSQVVAFKNAYYSDSILPKRQVIEMKLKELSVDNKIKRTNANSNMSNKNCEVTDPSLRTFSRSDQYVEIDEQKMRDEFKPNMTEFETYEENSSDLDDLDEIISGR